jgi:hypothetical protein
MEDVASAMRLYRISVEPARVLGADHGRAALEVSLPRIGGVTIFETRPEVLTRFLSLLETAGHPVPSVDLSGDRESSFGSESEGHLDAEVHTWFELYPDGNGRAASEASELLGLVAVRRVLVTDAGAVLDRDTPEDRVRWIKVRELVDRKLTASVRSAFVTHWEHFPDWLLRGLAAFPADDPRVEEVWRFRDSFSDPTKDAERRCLEWYAGVIFPGWRRAPYDLVEQKLGPLFASLEAATPDGRLVVRKLWSFLKSSVWRLPVAEGELPSGEDEALDKIRSGSLALLGVPLVCQGPHGWEFDLEPPDDSTWPRWPN